MATTAKADRARRLSAPLACFLALAVLAVRPAGAEEAFGPSIAEFLADDVRVLSRPVHTYHYVTRERAGLAAEGALAPDHPALEPYLLDKIRFYWSDGYLPSPGLPTGGLYLALDPVASRAFGGVGDGWALVEIVLSRGVRLLDVRTREASRDPADRLPEPARQRLAEAGCDAAFAYDLLIDRAPMPCRRAALATLIELEVDGLLYDFRAVDFRACRGPRNGAVLLLQREAFDLAEVRLFGVERPEDGHGAERSRIQALFLAARDAGSTRAPLWDGFDPRAAGDPAWMRRHLLACGDHPEDRAPARRQAGGDAAPTPRERYEDGRRLAREGRWRAAAEQYEAALAGDPDFPEALYELAWIRAAARDPSLRRPAEAVELAERLVEITHYRERRATVGRNWPRHLKVKASLTVAAAYAAAGEPERAAGYAHQAMEAAARQHEVSATPLTAEPVRWAEEALARYRRGLPPQAGPRPGGPF